ncbi:MAG: GDSL-type esterase/lipase family protein [Actinomycetota bacterium]
MTRRALIAAAVAVVAVALGAVGTPASSQSRALRVAPGATLSVSLPVDARVLDLPAGATLIDGRLVWDTTDADVGAHTVRTVRIDERGSWRIEETELTVRHPRRDDVYLSLGDSIASGHGLDRWDYLGQDDCWRAEGAAYARHVADGLAERGVDVDRYIVACSGAYLSDLSEEVLGGGPEGVVSDDRATQLDWAIRTNPGLITLTIGANDLGFIDPSAFIDDGGLDRAALQERIDAVEAGLIDIVDRLVDATDSTIVVTDYHDPSAENPHGVDGCSEACFAAATEEAVGLLSSAVERVADRHPGRVLHADAATPFDGHGAGNGRGPDVSRLGRGPLSRFLPAPVQGVSSYCAKGDHSNDTWVNAIDCVHPNGEGQEAYADAVLAALDAADSRG